jgi:hypothetical protein
MKACIKEIALQTTSVKKLNTDGGISMITVVNKPYMEQCAQLN